MILSPTFLDCFHHKVTKNAVTNIAVAQSIIEQESYFYPVERDEKSKSVERNEFSTSDFLLELGTGISI